MEGGRERGTAMIPGKSSRWSHNSSEKENKSKNSQEWKYFHLNFLGNQVS